MKTALACVLVLLCTACGGGSAAQEPSTTSVVDAVESEPSTTSTTAVTSTTSTTVAVETTVPFVFPESPVDKLAAVQISASDFGEGYENTVEPESEENTDQLCDGVDRLAVAMPAEAKDFRQFEGAHLFFSNVSVYPTAAEATEALNYLSGAYQQCNGGTRVADGETILLSASAFSPAAILGSDQTVGLLLEQTTPAVSLLTTTHLVAADRMLFFVGGTDPAVVAEMSDVLVGRTRLPSEPVQFAPAGSANIGPGYTQPAYYSFAEGPDQLRALPLSERALAWLNDSSLERVDEAASLSCVLTQTLSIGDSNDTVNAVLAQAFSEEELATYGVQPLGEVFGAATAIYCPMLSEFLLEVVAAIP